MARHTVVRLVDAGSGWLASYAADGVGVGGDDGGEEGADTERRDVLSLAAAWRSPLLLQHAAAHRHFYVCTQYFANMQHFDNMQRGTWERLRLAEAGGAAQFFGAQDVVRAKELLPHPAMDSRRRKDCLQGLPVCVALPSSYGVYVFFGQATPGESEGAALSRLHRQYRAKLEMGSKQPVVQALVGRRLVAAEAVLREAQQKADKLALGIASCAAPGEVWPTDDAASDASWPSATSAPTVDESSFPSDLDRLPGELAQTFETFRKMQQQHGIDKLMDKLRDALALLETAPERARPQEPRPQPASETEATLASPPRDNPSGSPPARSPPLKHARMCSPEGTGSGARDADDGEGDGGSDGGGEQEQRAHAEPEWDCERSRNARLSRGNTWDA